MDIRPIKTDEEKIAAELISLVAFHEKTDDIEKSSEEWKQRKNEDWGAFTDEGILAARIINNHFECEFDGQKVMCGGIGAVSTLPEYRNTGAIRKIFEKLLSSARNRGEILSALYPFSHSFYRKFGYETVTHKTEFTFSPSDLKGFSHDGWAKLWKPEDSVCDFTSIYSEFAKNYNLSIFRDDKKMKSEMIKGEYYKTRRFCYLLGDDSGATAYIVFQDKNGVLSVNETAWKNQNGFKSVLGFLSRFSADYEKIVLPLPTNLDLRHFVSNPYNIEVRPSVEYMIRVMNAEKALKILQKPKDCNFSIKIYGDEQIPENNGIWKTDGTEVVKCDEESVFPPADFEMSIKAFSQAIAGGADSDELKLRDDVQIQNEKKSGLFKILFHKKSIYVGDHF